MSLQTKSVWQKRWGAISTPPGELPKSCDVAIIGGGVAGLATAYELASAGMKVTVLESKRVGGGQTARSTAQVCTATDDRYALIEKEHGPENAAILARSFVAALDRVEDIILREEIDCQWERVDGFLFDSVDGRTGPTLESELAAARRAGLREVEMLDRALGIANEEGKALVFPRQGQLDPLRYAEGLAKAIGKLGGVLCESTHITEIGDRGGVAEITTLNGAILRADHLVIATNSPVFNRLALHTHQSAWRTYVISLELPPGSVKPAQYWDTTEPYHYVRVCRRDVENGSAPDYLLVGGEDRRTGQEGNAPDRFFALESWARFRFPMAKKLVWCWSGQILEPLDGLAFIGHNPGSPENHYVISGDSGQGITHSAIGGMLIRDLILKRPNEWSALYKPSRGIRSMSSALEFLKVQGNVGAQYLDYLLPGEISCEGDLARRAGGVIRKGLSKTAVYRDPEGDFHRMSAICPHMGGIVNWNAVEGTWDCPCHGARFACTGEVLNGPAAAGLRSLDPNPAAL